MNNEKANKRTRVFIYIQNSGEASDGMESIMCADLISNKSNTIVIQEDRQDKLAEFLARRKIQKLTNGKAGLLLFNRYKLGKTLHEVAPQYDDVFVFCFNFAFLSVRYPVSVLKAYKRQWPNVKFILHYPDPVSRPVASYANYLRENGVFDKVYSFDPKDSEEYEFQFWKTPYSSVEKYHQIKPNKDLYFVGYSMQRAVILSQIADLISENKIDACLDIIDGKEKIPYSEALRRTLEAKCILDVVRPNQTGMTLRYYEAVTYNRKLLTNNPSLFLFPYYDERFMQYFEKVEDIDWDWVKEDIEVDYHYNGEFSPLRLMEDIIKACEEQENR